MNDGFQGAALTWLQRRSQIEQLVVLILRCLAGNASDRGLATDAIFSLGGTHATVVSLARLVGAALAMGYELLPFSAPEVSVDETALLQQLAGLQHRIELSVENRHAELTGMLTAAAAALDGLTLRLSPPAQVVGNLDD